MGGDNSYMCGAVLDDDVRGAMAVRHRRNEKRLLKRTIAALERQTQQQGLDAEDLARAEGSTLGKLLPGDERKYGWKQKTALEDKLEKLGLPVDLK